MRNPRLFCYFAVLLPALLYWQVIEFSYVWDDIALFLDSAALRGGGFLGGCKSTNSTRHYLLSTSSN